MIRFENVTIYMRGELLGAYRAKKVKWVEITIGRYAQYPSAVKVKFLEKRKRISYEFVQTFQPSLVVAEGHDCPDPPSIFGEGKTDGNGVTVSKARHSSCSGGWKTDFEAAVLPNVKVLANYHGHDPMMSNDVQAN